MKCEWENCDSEMYDRCGLCGLGLCEYHFIHSETHDALDQRNIDLINDPDDDLDDDDEDWN
jgi:hypothetical protein